MASTMRRRAAVLPVPGCSDEAPQRTFTRYRMLATPATSSTPEAIEITDTWMASQYDLSAGTTARPGCRAICRR